MNYAHAWNKKKFFYKPVSNQIVIGGANTNVDDSAPPETITNVLAEFHNPI